MIEKIVYANMEWDVTDQPSLSDLPPEFKKSYDLYYENAEKNFTKIVNLLEPFLSGILIFEPDRRESPGDPDDLFACEAFEDSEESFGIIERESYLVQLVGVDFKVASPLPLVKTQALFKVPFVDNIDDIDPEDQCDMLAERFWDPGDVTLTFRWNLPDVDDDLDLSSAVDGGETTMWDRDTFD
tara:strand:+ start:74 stop:625 length:552 start_codon:yes stop_codon:yes gene_type:complete